MEKEEGLHELDEYLSDYVHIEALVVLGFDVAVNVHTQHLGYYALR